MYRRSFLAGLLALLGVNGCADRTENRKTSSDRALDVSRLIDSLGDTADPWTRDASKRELCKLGARALPALEKAAKEHPNSRVRDSARQLAAAITGWPCFTAGELSQNPRILEGGVRDFRHAEAKLSWAGTQLKPFPSIWFVSHGCPAAAHLFPERLNDFTLHNPFTVTAKEFAKMASSVKELAENPGKEGDLLLLDVVRLVDGHCDGYTLKVGQARLPRFYHSLLKALDAQNDEGRAQLKYQGRIVGAFREDKS